MKISASYHQERLWFIDTFETGYLYESNPIYHNIPLILYIKGPLDIDILEQAVRQVINRHEVLRTRIITEDNKPFQQLNQNLDFNLSILDLAAEGQEESFDNAVALAIAEASRPFLLHQEPLIRGQLTRFEHHAYILVVTIHHLVADRYSTGILAEEILLYYKGFLKSSTPQLPGLSIHYADFSQWQRQMPIKLEESMLGYWKIKLSGKLQVLELPTDNPRAAIHTYQAGRQSFTLPKTLTQQIKAYSKQEGISHFITLLAAFKVLLYKYSGLDEIVVGTSSSNRNQPGLERVVGPIANLLVLRSDLSGDPWFAKLVTDLAVTVKDAYQHQAMPFDKLVSLLNPDIDMSRTALFDVLFQYEDTPIHVPSIENLEIRLIETNLGWGKYDINILIQEEEDTFPGILVYNSDYYQPSTISRMLDHYRQLLAALLAYPHRPVSTFSLLTEPEQHQLLTAWNQTQINYPQDKTIHRLFADQVEQTPDHIALIGAHESRFEGTRGLAPLSTPISITYRQLNEKSHQLACLLLEKGVQPDTIVAIMLGRSVEMIASLLAILKANGAYLPIDPDYPDQRVQYMLKDSGAAMLVTTCTAPHVGAVGAVRELPLQLINLKEVLSIPTSTLTSTSTCQVSPANLAYIIYTSGTTGKPKGAGLTHRNVVRLMKNDGFQFDFNHRDAWTMFHRYCFDFSVWEMYGALLYGGKLIVIPKEVTEDLAEYLKILKNQQITVLNQTPTAFYNLVNIETQQPDRHLNIRYIIFGGEALNPVNLKKWKQKYPGTKLVNMYGITETTVHVTYKEITDREIQFNTSNIGKPIPTLSTYIMDNHLNLLPIGIPGELCVGGEGVGKGYLNRVELTNEKFVQNPCKKEEILFRSGDLVKLTGNGDMEYLGRIDNQVKIRGFRIELGEIENQLQKHEEIKHAAVVVREKKEDKYLCAYIVANNQLSATDLRKYLSKQLPDYMIPSYFVSLEKFPLTPNGKIDRKALPEPEIAMGKNYTAPRDTTEKQLAHIWWEVLSTGDKKPGTVGINDDFFELGGHSLKAITAIANIHKTFNVKIAVAELFKHPTVREMAGYIKSSVKTVDIYSAIEPAEKNDYYELSSAQKRLYIQQQIDLESTTYNLPLIVGLGNNIDKEKIDSIFRELTRRHEALRTSFELHHGIMIQKIHPEVTLKINYDDASTRKNDNNPDKDKMAHFNIEERLKDFIKPFDLSKPPLMKVSLTKWAEENYLLMVDMHHIITDGVSLNVLKSEFIALAREETLPALKIQYKDFSQWQNQRLESEEMKKQETFWLNTFKLPPPALDLPLDFNRPAFRSSQGNTLRIEINEELTAKTRKLNKETGTTLFMVLLAAYNILLHKYSGQADIVIGSPVSGRRHLDLEHVIGVFVNMISIRNFPAPGKSLANFLEEVKTNALEAYDNQDYPFEELVRKLGLQGETSRNPLFDVGLVLQNIDDANILDAGAPRENTPPDQQAVNQVSRFDVLFDVVELQNKIIIRLEYSTVLFRQSSIERLAKHYTEILNQVAENREIKLKDITVSTDLQSAASIDRGIDFEF